jgi:hypothetical protein
LNYPRSILNCTTAWKKFSRELLRKLVKRSKIQLQKDLSRVRTPRMESRVR